MLRYITRIGVGTVLTGIGSGALGIFTPETGWITEGVAQWLTISGIVVIAIGAMLILWGIKNRGGGYKPQGADITLVQGDLIQNFYYGESRAQEVKRMTSENGRPIHVESHNQQGGITAYQVNIQPGDRQLSAGAAQQVKDYLNKTKFKTIEVNAVMGDGEAFRFALQMKNYLTSEGFEVSGVNQVMYVEPPQGQIIEPPNDKGMIKIIVGSR